MAVIDRRSVGSTSFGGRSGPEPSISRRSVGAASRRAHPGSLRRRPTPRAAGTARAGRSRHATSIAGTPEEEFLARRGQRQSGATRTAPRNQRRARDLDNEGIIPVLARAVREVEAAAQRGPRAALGSHQVPGRRPAGARGARPGQGRHRPAPRPSAPSSSSASTGSPRSWPRPPPATPRCSRCSPRTPSSPTRPASLKREMLLAAGRRARARGGRPRRSRGRLRHARAPRRAAVGRRPPAGQPLPRPRLLRRRAAPAAPRAGWPAGSCSARCSGRSSSGGASSCMTLPEPTSLRAAQRPGADAPPGPGRSRPPRPATAPSCSPTSPGLGKTAQALLAAQAADAYPLLVVVPNVVKTNWAREAELWTPRRTRHRDPRRRRHDRRLRRHRRRQLRGARPARRLARRPRLPRHGRRRGALHQEQDVAALAARAAALRADPRPHRATRC